MDGFWEGWVGVAVLSFACKQFEVSSVAPQQIIKFALENKEAGSMCKHINTAFIVHTPLHIKMQFLFSDRI